MTTALRIVLMLLLLAPALVHADQLRGTGSLGLVVERAAGSVLIVDTAARRTVGRVEGLGDLSHAGRRVAVPVVVEQRETRI